MVEILAIAALVEGDGGEGECLQISIYLDAIDMLCHLKGWLERDVKTQRSMPLLQTYGVFVS